MEILKAQIEHKEAVLNLLDEFRTECMKIIDPEKGFVSESAKRIGGPVFENVVKSKDSAIFLAKERDKYVGIVTVYKIPQIRKGGHYAEIEEMYVIPEFQGKEVAEKLTNTVIKWSKENSVLSIRLESSNQLERAHGFYEKMGFKFYGRAYEKSV